MFSGLMNRNSHNYAGNESWDDEGGLGRDTKVLWYLGGVAKHIFKKKKYKKKQSYSNLMDLFWIPQLLRGIAYHS